MPGGFFGITTMTPAVRQFCRTFLFLILAVLLTPDAGAAEADEFYVNTYRSIATVSPKGSRSMAMGGTGRGLADGVPSLGVNPAALGVFDGKGAEVGLGYDWLADGNDNTDQISFRLGGAISLERWKPSGGFNQAIGGLLETKSYSGAAGVDMNRNQTGVLMAYGLHLLDNLLGGVSVALYDGKWTSRQQADSAFYLDRKFTGGDFRLGTLYRLSDATTIGGVLGYATGSLREKAQYAANAGTGSLDRYSLGVGVAHQFRENTLLLGDLWYDRMKSDVPSVLKEDNKSWGLSLGVEQNVIPEVMALRGGLYYDRASYSSDGTGTFVSGGSFSKGRFGLTAGIGVKLYPFDLGYSLDVNSGGDVKNLLEVSAEW